MGKKGGFACNTCTNCFDYHEGNEHNSISVEITLCVVFCPSFCSLHALVLTLRKVSVTQYDIHGMFLTLLFLYIEM